MLTFKHVFDIIAIEHTFGGVVMKQTKENDRKKRNKKRFLKGIIILSMAFILFLQFIPTVKSQSIVNYDKVTVCSGDTIWSIASEYIEENQDVRKLVYDIRELNKLTSAVIMPGQELLIPCE
jgi:LysM repeat protein